MIRIVIIISLLSSLLFAGNEEKIKKLIDSLYPESLSVSSEKFQISDSLLTEIRTSYNQRLFSEYLYIYKIKTTNGIKTAIFDITYSKSMPFSYIVFFNENSEVLKVEIIDYYEQYGGEIKSRNWLDSLNGMSSLRRPDPGVNVNAISGATISSNNLIKAINKLLLVLQDYKKKK